jgi:hypothetical protein
MHHVLMRCRDAASGGVVVRPEVGGDNPAAAFTNQPRQRDRAVGGEY